MLLVCKQLKGFRASYKLIRISQYAVDTQPLVFFYLRSHANATSTDVMSSHHRFISFRKRHIKGTQPNICSGSSRKLSRYFIYLHRTLTFGRSFRDDACPSNNCANKKRKLTKWKDLDFFRPYRLMFLILVSFIKLQIINCCS